jgi:hypothetical protein
MSRQPSLYCAMRNNSGIRRLLIPVEAIAAECSWEDTQPERRCRRLERQRHHGEVNSNGTPKAKREHSGRRISCAKNLSPSFRCSHRPQVFDPRKYVR